MIWTLITLIVIVTGWYWFEGGWDRRLFTEDSVNMKAPEAKAYLAAHPETQVLDVRSANEFQGGALPGAVNVSIGDTEFESKVGQMDRAKPVLVYCAGGFRSRKAVEKLKALGFKTIRHLHRGYMSWKG